MTENQLKQTKILKNLYWLYAKDFVAVMDENVIQRIYVGQFVTAVIR